MQPEHQMIILSPEKELSDDDTAELLENPIEESVPLESEVKLHSEISAISQRNSLQKTVTPALFDDQEVTPVKFAPFGNKQSVVTLQDLKKDQTKKVQQWDKPKLKETLKPSHSRQSLQSQPKQSKYSSVESKVKQQLKRTQSPVIARAPKKQSQTRRVTDLNISEINQSNSHIKQEDQSMIQDLIELDFVQMINQINQKKDILLHKIKAIHHSIPTQEVTKQTRTGQIVRNQIKLNSKPVEIIDLYQNMMKRGRAIDENNKENTGLVEQPSPIKPKRQPGKISRKNSTKKPDDIQKLEEEYRSALFYAQSIQEKILSINNNSNNKNNEFISV